MDTKPLKLYFDYKSPIVYLAKDEAYQLEADYQVQIEWLPYVVNIPQVYGDLQTRDPQQWRRLDTLMNAKPALSARIHGRLPDGRPLKMRIGNFGGPSRWNPFPSVVCEPSHHEGRQ